MNTLLRRRITAAAMAAGTWLASPGAIAAVVTLTPSSATIVAGAPVVVDVRVSALGSGTSLGGFDLDVSFNPAFLSFTSIAFGSALGNPALFEALTSFSATTPGVIDLSEVSLLSAAELAAAQGASFSLATLTFSGVAAGSSLFTVLPSSTLSDAFGRPLPIITAAIPEPESVALLGVGLALLATMRRKTLLGGTRRLEVNPA